MELASPILRQNKALSIYMITQDFKISLLTILKFKFKQKLQETLFRNENIHLMMQHISFESSG